MMRLLRHYYPVTRSGDVGAVFNLIQVGILVYIFRDLQIYLSTLNLFVHELNVCLHKIPSSSDHSMLVLQTHNFLTDFGYQR